jgi:cellulose synthase/poly-beta-1,6-N-acetylglucosamine synthase-like glycosyltransferase
MRFLDEFVNYIYQLSPDKFLRVFWYFFIFEFLLHFVVDLVVVFLWKTTKGLKKNRLKFARQRLMNSHPLVSIIVPGKNEGKHIYQLVNTLREQTYTNFELIVIDDGSDDETPMICNSLQKCGYIDLFLSNEVRGGKASAANLGLRYSRGEYVIHLDADCSYDCDAIENILIPFFYNNKVAGVGGNVAVRNYDETLCSTLQAIEYYNTISIGRIARSELGIYRVISGAFGAFRRDTLNAVGGWDIGPGLDGDVTVKIRKLGYKIRFEPSAMCQTSAPIRFKALAKQRARWDKSLIRFRLRKHKDVFYPNATFRWSNFFSFVENIAYSLLFNIKWYLYAADMMMNFWIYIGFILAMNFLMYTAINYVKFIVFSLFRDRKNAPVSYFMLYIPLVVPYFNLFLRSVRMTAHIKEFFFKASYNDPWNPHKSSRLAKQMKI